MMKINDLMAWCHETLNASAFKDYAPNGLQVAGNPTVRSIVLAVTASLNAIRFCAEQNADLLLVHHGMFWRNEQVPLTGWKYERIAHLIKHNINLAGFHLPLDAHPTLGNNAMLGQLLGFQTEGATGEQNLLMFGSCEGSPTLQELGQRIGSKLQRKPLILCNSLTQNVKRIAWCTGGGQSFMQVAVDLGVDAFLTGEVSEAQYHLTKETGVAFISAGHHATERGGIQALGQLIEQTFSLPCVFFDEQNPV